MWFTDTMYLPFSCPVSPEGAQCEPTGEWFVLKQPKEELRKAMPYLLAGLQVLKVSVAAGRCFGLPLPYVGAIETKMEKAAEMRSTKSGPGCRASGIDTNNNNWWQCFDGLKGAGRGGRTMKRRLSAAAAPRRTGS